MMENNSNKPCARGHHKRRKKNARSRFDRRKNDERRRQQANKENISVLPPPKSTTGIIPDSILLLPKHWQKLSDTQYCKVEEGSNGLGEVTASVILDSDRTWNANVGDKKVPDTCDVLARFRSFPLTDDKLSDMIKAIDNAVLCPGNPDEKFVSACKDKGGCVRGARGNGDVVAFIDKSSVTVVTSPAPRLYAKGRRRQTKISGRRLECSIRLVWLYTVCWVLVPSSWLVQDAR